MSRRATKNGKLFGAFAAGIGFQAIILNSQTGQHGFSFLAGRFKWRMMNAIWISSLFAVVSSLAVDSCEAAETVVPKGTVTLFDGRDLGAFDIWLGEHQHQNKDNVFTIVDRGGEKVIRISGEHWGGLVTQQAFADYVLAFDYAWGTATFGQRQGNARNSGVLLHCQGELGNYAADFKGPWMKSIEFEMMEGGTGDIILVRGYDRKGNLAVPEMTAKTDGQSIRWNASGQFARFPNDEAKPKGRIWWKDRDPTFQDKLGYRGAKDAEKPLGEWNHVELTCRGDDVLFVVNDRIVNEGIDSSLSSGKVFFQSEGAEIFLRRIELRPVSMAMIPETVKADEFPSELTKFDTMSKRQLFSGTGEETWDRQIRERGWVMREGNEWHFWYTGYRESRDIHQLGYATSQDGLKWTRWPDNPLPTKGWVEDICVIKQGDTYYMFAEGLNDVAHMLTSTDRVRWTEHGSISIRKVNGKPIAAGPYGTPTGWFEDGVWWLFYEREDGGIYAATSRDTKVWTNISDLPVIARGPEAYDQHAVAMDQIIKHQGRYYAYYHASGLPDWNSWTSCLAMSDDLMHWRKFPGNPVLPVDDSNPKRSSPVIVHDGAQFRLYTAHPDLRVHFSEPIGPRKSASDR